MRGLLAIILSLNILKIFQIKLLNITRCVVAKYHYVYKSCYYLHLYNVRMRSPSLPGDQGLMFQTFDFRLTNWNIEVLVIPKNN